MKTIMQSNFSKNYLSPSLNISMWLDVEKELYDIAPIVETAKKNTVKNFIITLPLKLEFILCMRFNSLSIHIK